LRNVCVARSASLLFHAGHDRQRNINAGSTQRMLNAYNPKLRKYLIDNHYMENAGVSHHPGQQDHRHVRLPGMSAVVRENANSAASNLASCRLNREGRV
jgi:hypothetical protein